MERPTKQPLPGQGASLSMAFWLSGAGNTSLRHVCGRLLIWWRTLLRLVTPKSSTWFWAVLVSLTRKLSKCMHWNVDSQTKHEDDSPANVDTADTHSQTRSPRMRHVELTTPSGDFPRPTPHLTCSLLPQFHSGGIENTRFSRDHAVDARSPPVSIPTAAHTSEPIRLGDVSGPVRDQG